MSDDPLRPKNYRFIIHDDSPPKTPAAALADSIARADLEISAWLAGLADLLDRQRNRYWRAQLTSAEFQRELDRAFAEMREVAALLRSRPINVQVR